MSGSAVEVGVTFSEETGGNFKVFLGVNFKLRKAAATIIITIIIKNFLM
jgi:hypothetical protein